VSGFWNLPMNPIWSTSFHIIVMVATNWEIVNFSHLPWFWMFEILGLAVIKKIKYPPNTSWNLKLETLGKVYLPLPQKFSFPVKKCWKLYNWTLLSSVLGEKIEHPWKFMLSSTTCASQIATYLLKFVADHNAHSHKALMATESTQSPSVDWLNDWLISSTKNQLVFIEELVFAWVVWGALSIQFQNLCWWEAPQCGCVCCMWWCTRVLGGYLILLITASLGLFH
jgi:hypothetical protein